MPPIRTAPVSRPMKTERTHEENQERAYIAASRRSDRSLEARIESARRASDIHKKRTGRALRVTEQDVINEEMYEEEDDLPGQYRRLLAAYTTSNSDFNRRFHAYLASQHATRTAIADGQHPYLVDNYIQPYGSAPAFAPALNFSQPPPQSYTLPPHMFHQSSHSQSEVPLQQVPTNEAQHYRPSPHQRSQSIATPAELHGRNPHTFRPSQSPHTDDQRRMSVPQFMSSPARHQDRSNRSSSRAPSNDATTNDGGSLQPSPAAVSDNSLGTHYGKDQAGGGRNDSVFEEYSLYPSGNPMTPALPANTQQFLGPYLDQQDPYSGQLLSGYEHIPHPFSSYHPNAPMKPDSGLNQTLGMGMGMGGSIPTDFGPFSPPSHLNMPEFNFSFDENADHTQTTTPGEWAGLLNTSVWDEPSLSQHAAT